MLVLSTTSGWDTSAVESVWASAVVTVMFTATAAVAGFIGPAALQAERTLDEYDSLAAAVLSAPAYLVVGLVWGFSRAAQGAAALAAAVVVASTLVSGGL